MLKLIVNKFEDLSKKVFFVENMSEAERRMRFFFSPCDEIHLKDGKYLIHRENELVGAALVEKVNVIPRKVFRGDIFFADLGEEDGTNKQAGERPVLVVSNESCNKYSSIISVVALTTQDKTKLPTHVNIKADEDNGLEENSLVLCEQIISLPKDLLKCKKGRLNNNDMRKIDKALKVQLNL